MTFEEQLRYLKESTESLHASMQEAHAMLVKQIDESKRQDERFDRLRTAMVRGLNDFLNELGEEGTNGDT